MKLREVYQKLRSEHIVLLRTNGESQKRLQGVDQEKANMEEEIKVCGVLVMRKCEDALTLLVVFSLCVQKYEDKISALTMEIEEIKIHAVCIHVLVFFDLVGQTKLIPWFSSLTSSNTMRECTFCGGKD